MAAGRRIGRLLTEVMRWLLLLPIVMYRRLISPALPASCRYYPSCASYAEEALRQHGPFRGGWLTVRRLGRCHPWTPGGVDHVPDSPRARADAAQEPQPSTVTGA